MTDRKLFAHDVDDDTPLCRRCHYPMLHATHPHCPECGEPFDPNDLATLTSPAEINRRRIGPVPVAVFAAGVVITLLLMMVSPLFGLLATLLFGVVVMASVRATIASRPLASPRRVVLAPPRETSGPAVTPSAEATRREGTL